MNRLRYKRCCRYIKRQEFWTLHIKRLKLRMQCEWRLRRKIRQLYGKKLGVAASENYMGRFYSAGVSESGIISDA